MQIENATGIALNITMSTTAGLALTIVGVFALVAGAVYLIVKAF
jgi:hypothetical protein